MTNLLKKLLNHCPKHGRWLGCPKCAVIAERVLFRFTTPPADRHWRIGKGELPPALTEDVTLVAFDPHGPHSPAWQTKLWGRTRCVAKGPAFEVHELEIKMGGFSSKHKHRKWNMFLVQSGTLDVEAFHKSNPTGPATDVVTLIGGQNDRIEVQPDFIHRFRAQSDCRVLEVYWTDQIDPGDIKRYDEGGLAK